MDQPSSNERLAALRQQGTDFLDVLSKPFLLLCRIAEKVLIWFGDHVQEGFLKAREPAQKLPHTEDRPPGVV